MSVFGWSLPPGVTQRDIDEAYRGGDIMWSDKAIHLRDRIQARLADVEIDAELGPIPTIREETPREKELARIYWYLCETLLPDPQRR